MKFFCGLDIGSTTSKAVIVDESGKLISWAVIPTGYDPDRASEEVFKIAVGKVGLTASDIDKTVATGYGRMRVKWADKNVTEITCHAKGAHSIFPDTRTIIDIGGQDSKAIRIDADGKVLDFAMNDKCSAGTGRFLENMARVLDLSMEDMTRFALEAKETLKISSTCTVFAESEVVSLIHQGKDRNSIIKGLFDAIVSRIIPLAVRVGIEREVTLTGGVAKNKGIVDAVERALGFKVKVPENPQIVGALGAAIIALRG